MLPPSRIAPGAPRRRRKLHLLQGSHLPPELSGIREEQREVVEAPVACGAPKHDHATLVANRQRTKQKRLGHGEHRGRESDADGEGKNRGERKPGGTAEAPNPDANILQQVAHERGWLRRQRPRRLEIVERESPHAVIGQPEIPQRLDVAQQRRILFALRDVQVTDVAAR